MLFRKIHRLRCAFRKNPPTAIYVFRLQLVGFWIKDLAAGGFFESALRSWWIFIRTARYLTGDYSQEENGLRVGCKSHSCSSNHIMSGSAVCFSERVTKGGIRKRVLGKWSRRRARNSHTKRAEDNLINLMQGLWFFFCSLWSFSCETSLSPLLACCS